LNNALAAKASVLLRPASRRNRVLMPQLKEAASVDSKVSSREVRWTRLASPVIPGAYIDRVA